MVERIEGMDAAFLEMESATMHLHIVGVVVVDPTTAPEPVTPERLAEVYAERLHLIPPLRHRLVAVPGRLDRPRWIDDPDIDLAAHIHHHRLSGRAGRSDLEGFVAEVASRPLRRDIPLWEVWLVDGFADGTVAMVTKIHHALMDGSASTELMAGLFDDAPVPRRPVPPAPDVVVEPAPSPARLVADAVPAAVGRILRLPVAVVRTVVSLAGSARAIAAAPASVVGLAPRSPINGALTSERSVAFASVPLADFTAIDVAFGVTVNDVVLVATTRALRDYLMARDVLPDHPLVAAIPVAGRHDAGDYGNHTSNMMVSLPVHLHDPVDALAGLHETALGAKAAKGALDSRILDEWISVLPPVLLGAGSAAYSRFGLGRFHPPLFNAVVSNVAGPPIPLYLAGARIVALHPMGPLIGNGGLNLTVLSHDGVVDVGIIACPALVDDVHELAERWVGTVRELARLAHAETARRERPTGEGDGAGRSGTRAKGRKAPKVKGADRKGDRQARGGHGSKKAGTSHKAKPHKGAKARKEHRGDRTSGAGH